MEKHIKRLEEIAENIKTAAFYLKPEYPLLKQTVKEHLADFRSLPDELAKTFQKLIDKHGDTPLS